MPKDAISLHRKLRGKIFVGSKITPLKLTENHIIPILGDKRLQKRITASLTKLRK